MKNLVKVFMFLFVSQMTMCMDPKPKSICTDPEPKIVMLRKNIENIQIGALFLNRGESVDYYNILPAVYSKFMAEKWANLEDTATLTIAETGKDIPQLTTNTPSDSLGITKPFKMQQNGLTIQIQCTYTKQNPQNNVAMLVITSSGNQCKKATPIDFLPRNKI
ncbi:MAG: hypothetical protein Q8Q60_01180 [Candidatus Chromulinivorax sp.]|nr:hypothetical protein [Candidatus Chromulinivorax sp.]